MKGIYRSAPMDSRMINTTLFGIALLAVLLAVALFYGTPPPMVVAPLMAAALGGSWQVRPVRYEITDDAVIILRGRPFRNIIIPLTDVHQVRRITPSGTTIRIFGVGGLFGSTGWFWSKGLRHFFVAVTSAKDTVLIANGKKYVISPEKLDEFVADVRHRIGSQKLGQSQPNDD